MRWPLIISQDGAVGVYRTAEELATEDANDLLGYGPIAAYDSEGRRVRVSAQIQEPSGFWSRLLRGSREVALVTGWEPDVTHADELAHLLRTALAKIGEPAPPECSLQHLVSAATDWFGGA